AIAASIPQLERRVQDAQKLVAEVDNFWHRTFDKDTIERRKKLLETREAELRSALQALEAWELVQFLDLDPASIGQAFESGLRQANLEETLRGKVESALIRAWASSSVMVEMQE